MKRELALLDSEVFSRTTAIFSAKRATLAPEAVEAVASDIVRRLARSPSRIPDLDVPQISEESADAFCDALILPDSNTALRFIEDRRAEGMSLPGVYLGYISGGARRLGERWERDELSFFQVTCGTGHLYALMRALRTEIPLTYRKFDNRRVALFATVPGEDHGIGITVAADLFREAGWEIDLETGTDHEELIAHVEQTLPHIIGFSFSTEQRLDALVRLVVATRIVIPDAIIGVAPSSSIGAERLHDLVDIDLVFSDAPSAFRELDRLIRLRS
ncbi:B12-binding domain-containing protein [Rhodobacter sp. SY28-1]|uniref:cobalamin B12-binding domain-containing protein n=1 Tax=Rhodobacter sp. SY28-1 TaxID=2562317 RepID=UPI0014850001|nr:cobalamin-dependent protein [Rhodobacter sp. SY28-1]